MTNLTITISELQEQHWFFPINQDNRQRFNRTISFDKGRHYIDINTLDPNYTDFLNQVNRGDKIWFIDTSHTDSKLIGVVTYNSHKKRVESCCPFFDKEDIEMYNAEIGNDANISCSNYYQFDKELSVYTYVTLLDRPVLYTNTCVFDAPIEYKYIQKYVKLVNH
jgi:hypothetical protein